MERPIILKAHEVRGILDGRQTQLRRIIKPQPDHQSRDGVTTEWCWRRTERNEPARSVGFQTGETSILNQFCPFGQVGDRLWGKETTWVEKTDGSFAWYVYQNVFPVDATKDGVRKKSSVHMTRKESRILLEIVSVRVERVLDITDEDALESGIIQIPDSDWFGWEGCSQAAWSRTAASAFHSLCETFDGNGTCYSNAWQWVVEFKRVEA